MKKKLLIYVAIGLLIILSVIVFLRISQTTPKPIPEADFKAVDQAPDDQDSGQFNDAEALAIAKSIISWADTMKNDLGQYHLRETCIDSQCNREPIDKQAGILVVWARFKLLQKTKDPLLLKKISEDLTVLTTLNIGSPAQNDMLNCSLMHEMHSSDLFSKELKEKIYAVCDNSIFYGDAMKDYVDLESKKIKINEPDIEGVLANNSVTGQTETVAQHFDKYSNYASDLADVTTWFADPENLEAAKFFFNLALELYSKKEPNILEAAIGPASVRLYQATKEEKYLQFAGKLIEERKENNKICLSTQDCAYFAHFLSILYQETDDISVKERLREVLIYLKEASYDSEKGLYKNIRNDNEKLYQLPSNILIAGVLAAY